MERKIIKTEWRSSRTNVGIVAVQHKYGWCAYIGIALGGTEESDAEGIADWGAKLSENEAKAFFPSLEKYKYEFE